MRATTMSPAKRIATAAIAAVLLGGTPGLAMAATSQAAMPSQQTENWFRYEVVPANHIVKSMEVGSNGKVVVADRERNDDHQFWSLNGAAGKQLMKNKATGTCLTAASNGSQGSITLQTCDENNVNQQWKTEYWSQGRHTISLAAHPDLYLTGSDRIGGEVTVEIYHGTFAQHWSTVPPGY
ncbi:RICIN domain-containing protein [Streptomyces sp. NPDC094049]|uniref:RICIN domain-containing protein n=1 Tax=Streptomyces sp. NPDC094049 TaxID=3154987 RepID=UPI003320292C